MRRPFPPTRSSAVRPAPSTHRRTDRGRRCACCPSGRPRSRAAARRRGRSRASRAASRRRRTAIARCAVAARDRAARCRPRHASAGTAGARRPRAAELQHPFVEFEHVDAALLAPAEMRFERNHVERHEAEHHLAHLVRRAGRHRRRRTRRSSGPSGSSARSRAPAPSACAAAPSADADRHAVGELRDHVARGHRLVERFHRHRAGLPVSDAEIVAPLAHLRGLEHRVLRPVDREAAEAVFEIEAAGVFM